MLILVLKPHHIFHYSAVLGVLQKFGFYVRFYFNSRLLLDNRNCDKQTILKKSNIIIFFNVRIIVF